MLNLLIYFYKLLYIYRNTFVPYTLSLCFLLYTFHIYHKLPLFSMINSLYVHHKPYITIILYPHYLTGGGAVMTMTDVYLYHVPYEDPNFIATKAIESGPPYKHLRQKFR